MIVAIVSAHDGPAGVERSVTSLRGQSPPPERIVVVPGATADAEGAARSAGAEVLAPSGAVRHRAGGLNRALEALELTERDLVLVLDAGTRLAPGFVAGALEELRDPEVGAVAAVPRGEDPKGWLEHMQQLERIRRAGQLHRRGGAEVLAGAASLIRWRALQDVQWIFGRHYDEDSSAEDGRLALDLRTAGWKLSSPPGGGCTTEPAPTLRLLLRQRRRRCLGTLQNVTAHGLTPASAPPWRRELVPSPPALLVLVHLVLTAAAVLLGWSAPGLPWLLAGAGVALAAERTATVRDAGPRARLTAAAVLPELVYGLLLQGAAVAALHQHLTRRGDAARPVAGTAPGARGRAAARG